MLNMWNNECINIDESLYKKLRFRREEAFYLQGHHLLILLLLGKETDGLTEMELMTKLMCDNKMHIEMCLVCIALKELEEHKYITINGVEGNYILKYNVISNNDLKFINLPIDIINKVINGNLSAEALRVCVLIKFRLMIHGEVNYNIIDRELHVCPLSPLLKMLEDEDLLRKAGHVVYRIYNDNNDCTDGGVDNHLLYVGRTSDIDKRIPQHAYTQFWWDLVTRIEYSEALNKNESRIYEIYYISKLKPIYNKEFCDSDDVHFDLPELRFRKYISLKKQQCKYIFPYEDDDYYE